VSPFPLQPYIDFVASVPTRSTTDLIEILIEGHTVLGHRTHVLQNLINTMYPQPALGPAGQTGYTGKHGEAIFTTRKNALAVVADEINRRLPSR
jgi:hypothetical protein